MTGVVGTETSTTTVKTLTCMPSSNRVKKKNLTLCVFVCVHVNFEAVIEMFVCANDVRLGGRMVVPPWLVNPNRKSRLPISGAKSEGSPKPTGKGMKDVLKRKRGFKNIIALLCVASFHYNFWGTVAYQTNSTRLDRCLGLCVNI